jgi:hypothetical protein
VIAKEFHCLHVPRRNQSDLKGRGSMIWRRISGGRIGRVGVGISGVHGGGSWVNVVGSLMSDCLRINKLRSLLDKGDIEESLNRRMPSVNSHLFARCSVVVRGGGFKVTLKLSATVGRSKRTQRAYI